MRGVGIVLLLKSILHVGGGKPGAKYKAAKKARRDARIKRDETFLEQQREREFHGEKRLEREMRDKMDEWSRKRYDEDEEIAEEKENEEAVKETMLEVKKLAKSSKEPEKQIIGQKTVRRKLLIDTVAERAKAALEKAEAAGTSEAWRAAAKAAAIAAKGAETLQEEIQNEIPEKGGRRRSIRSAGRASVADAWSGTARQCWKMVHLQEQVEEQAAKRGEREQAAKEKRILQAARGGFDDEVRIVRGQAQKGDFKLIKGVWKKDEFAEESPFTKAVARKEPKPKYRKSNLPADPITRWSGAKEPELIGMYSHVPHVPYIFLAGFSLGCGVSYKVLRF
eukprot:gnl/MRDRNA2_/MRDRNA2_99560_c0_seq1.p1 gnl/MRDRNA2_/MRDRNA2_99560_c0~~gnl/MRDRNA2_/MRDRNA2_99560_c0_seq1.p1  ORF type:complete len:337 (+),score=87.52 gnl/MRDRNA2_/MRDRNA2_99560_c0_seq1:227-1237(+)